MRRLPRPMPALAGLFLVNNVLFSAAPIVEIGRDDYRICSTSISSTLFTMQAVARQMIERGTGGKIINMASQAGSAASRLWPCIARPRRR